MKYVDKLLAMLKNHNSTSDISEEVCTSDESNKSIFQNIIRTELGQLFKGHKLDLTYYQENNRHFLTMVNTYFSGSVVLTYDITAGTTVIRDKVDGPSPKWMSNKLMEISILLCGRANGHYTIESETNPSLQIWGGSYYVEHSLHYDSPFFTGHKENIDRLKMLGEFRKNMRKKFKQMPVEDIAKFCRANNKQVGGSGTGWVLGSDQIILDENFLKGNVMGDVLTTPVV